MFRSQFLSIRRAAAPLRAASALALAAAVSVAVLGLPSSASALSCGRRLVSNGDTAAYVQSICGEPTQVSTRTESRTVYGAQRVVGGIVVGDSRTVTVEITVWIYDFGPQRLMQELTFENGVLQNVRTLSYGTPEGARRS
jgi:hypothetical protein